VTPARQNKDNDPRTGQRPITIQYNTRQRPGMTAVTVNDNKNTEVTPTTQYCGEYYDENHAWKDILAEQEEYIELLTLQNVITETGIISRDIPSIPCIPKTDIPITIPPSSQWPKENNEYMQYSTYYPTPQKATETKQHTRPTYSRYHIPNQPKQEHKEEVQVGNNIRSTIEHEPRANKRIQATEQEQDQEHNQDNKQEKEQEYYPNNTELEKFVFQLRIICVNNT